MRLALLLLAGCDTGTALVVSLPLESDQIAAVVVTDDRGTSLDSKPLLLERGTSARIGFEVGAPFRIVAQVYGRTAATDDLDRCGLTLRGDGAPLPSPEATWTSPLFREVPQEIALALDPSAVPLEVRSGCDAPPTPDLCAGLGATIVPVDGQNVRSFQEIAFTSRSSAVLREYPSERSNGGLFAIELVSGIDTLISEDNPTAIAADHLGAFYAAYSDGRVKRVFRNGLEAFSAQLPCALTGIAAQKDVGAIAWGPTCAYAFSGTSSIATALTDFPAQAKDVLLVSDRRIAAYAERTLHVFDGSAWVAEHDQVTADVRLAGNAMHLAAAGSSDVLLRDEPSRAWSTLPVPNFPGAVLGIVVSPEGRPLVVGQNGLSHFWNDGDWCLLSASSGWYLDIDISDDGTQAAALSSNQGRTAIVLFDLTER